MRESGGHQARVVAVAFGGGFRRMAALLWFLACGMARGGAAEPSAQFDAAAKLYEEGRHLDAARAYERLATNGVVTASVWFNQGNAWFQAGRIGKAVACYRAAQRIAPRDADVAANLNLARSKVPSGSPPPPGVEYPYLSLLTSDEWAWAAMGGLWLWMGLLAVRTARPGLRDGTRSLAWGLGAITVLLAVAAGLSWTTSGRGVAVVTVAQATARFGPLPEAQGAFTLNEGIELRIVDRKNDWLQVRDGQGRQAWVVTGEVAEIR